MAFAVRDARQSLKNYQDFLPGAEDANIVEYDKSRTRVALFRIGGIEYQLCESYDADGRFSEWISRRGGEGLHHICYAVPSIDAALDNALAHGASLRMCKACGVKGSHPHPEGFVAFLGQEVSGLEVEFMQLYSEQELKDYSAVKGI